MAPRTDAWRRRHALQIAAQLPDDPRDAYAVLEYVRELLAFTADRAAIQERALVVPFSASKASAASSSLRPKS